MNDYEIEQLLSVSDTSCISIIVPTHRYAQGKNEDSLILNKAVNQVRDLLDSMRSSQTDALIKKMNSMCESVDFSHSKDGIGVFVSPVMSRLVTFPFAVKPRVTMGNHFEGRELLYFKSIPEYLVLSLSRKIIRLYRGKGEELHQVADGRFPFSYEESYEYERPCRANMNSYSLKSFEKDKSILQETRFKDFARTVDRALTKYVSQDIPLVLCGESKELTAYMKITRHSQYIIGKVPGNYPATRKKNANAIWEFVLSHTKTQNELLVKKLPELVGRKMVVSGIGPVHQAIEEGGGLVLLVEKDIESGPDEGHSIAVASSMIDQVLREFMQKKGKVIFMDNGTLKDFGGLALILRYHSSLN